MIDFNYFKTSYFGQRYQSTHIFTSVGQADVIQSVQESGWRGGLPRSQPHRSVAPRDRGSALIFLFAFHNRLTPNVGSFKKCFRVNSKNFPQHCDSQKQTYIKVI